LVRRFAQPVNRLLQIRLHLQPILAPDTQAELCAGDALPGCFREPQDRLHVIRRNTFAVFVRDGEAQLGGCIVLVSSLEVPVRRFLVVLGKAVAFRVQTADPMLRFGAALGGRAIASKCKCHCREP
jgi:hypothetical protein